MEINIPNNATFACSSTTLNEIVSSNSQEYWCWDKRNVFETDLKVKKDTKEGKEITKCLEEIESGDKSMKDLQRIIDLIIIANMSDIQVLEAHTVHLKNSCKESYENGRKSKLSEIQVALGINNKSW